MSLRSRFLMLFPAGPITALTLLGLLMLGAILNHRAVEFLRFIEPTLAVTKPRFVFSHTINKLMIEEFRFPNANDIHYAEDSIRVRRSLIEDDLAAGGSMGVLKGIGNVLYRLMQDPATKDRIDIFLVGARVPISGDDAIDARLAHDAQDTTEVMVRAIYQMVPELKQQYEERFVSAAFPTSESTELGQWIEFHVVPRERLHVDMMLKMQQYVR